MTFLWIPSADSSSILRLDRCLRLRLEQVSVTQASITSTEATKRAGKPQGLASDWFGVTVTGAVPVAGPVDES
jgi:hypothetical protein